MVRWLENLTCEERVKKLDLFSLERRKWGGDHNYDHFHYVKGCYTLPLRDGPEVHCLISSKEDSDWVLVKTF